MRTVLILAISLVIFACKSGNTKPQEQTEAVPAAAAQETFGQYELSEMWRTDSTLKVPESVIYDEARKILYVSNINGDPRTKDRNGFISKVSLDGKITDLQWVDSLNAPKGMAIVGEKLYVADIDELVEIDITSGKIARRHVAKDSKMLNDVTSSPSGELFISDSDGNKIYHFVKQELSEWLSFGLKGPNGLLVSGDTLLVASSGSMDFTAINLSSRQKSILTGGINHGDGVVPTGVRGQYIVSDWDGEVFLVYRDNTKVSLLNTKDKKINSADIWFVPGENLLLVPTFSKNTVVAYKLVQKGSA